MRTRNRRKRHFVSLQTISETKGTRGQKTGTWSTTTRDIPSIVKTLSGTELELSRKLYTQATYSVEMMKPGIDITTEHRLKFGTKTLQIGFVEDLENRGRELKILCSEET